jgi:hypothetical protein
MRIIAALMAIFLGSASAAETIQVRERTPLDETVLEEWERVTTERDVSGVGVSKISETGYSWQVFINVAEFIRKEPLQGQLFTAISQALLDVPGVTSAVQEDREVWLVKGSPTGEELVRHCSRALNNMYPQLKAEYESL